MAQSSTVLPDPLKKVSVRAWLITAVMAALIAVAFRAPILWMVDRWVAAESYYSHGFFVPFVALYFVWQDRRRLLAQSAKSSLVGLSVMLAGLLLLLASGFQVVYFTAVFGLILTVWGLCGFLFGLKVFRRLLFPVFILTFMVPLPLSVIAEISLKMKLFATQMALFLLDLFNIIATNEGSTIYMESGAVVTVGNACSGLRSLISLIFLGVIFAAVTQLSPPRKAILFLSSIPIAIVANIVRVFLLCVIANQWGSDKLGGLVHDASGYMIFVVAFCLLYGMLMILEIGRRPVPSPAGSAEAGQGGHDARFRARVLLALILLGVAAAVSALTLYPERMDRGKLKAASLPLMLGPWIGREVAVEEYVKKILETDDVIQRNYTDPRQGPVPVQLSVVFSGDNRRVAHPPDVCYRGSGWEVIEKQDIHPAGLPAMKRLIIEAGVGKRDMVIYCYKAGEQITANYYRQQYNIAVNQLMRRAASSALIRFSSPMGGTEAETERRLVDFIRLMLPEIQKCLKD